MNTSLVRKLIVECIETFFLVYVIGCVSLQEHVLLGALAIGASLMVMIFAGGHISGAHYNPAVTLGVWIRAACRFFDDFGKMRSLPKLGGCLSPAIWRGGTPPTHPFPAMLVCEDIRLKNSTVFSSVSRRPSCGYGVSPID